MEIGGTIVDLRKLLATRFPSLRMDLGPRKSAECVRTGIAALDTLLGGGLLRGAFTELIASGYGSGSVEVIHELLRQVACNRQFLALVDGRNSFDVAAVQPAVLRRLLWVRCQNVNEALKATDLLLRDRNFPVLVLDLRLNSTRELRKVSASVWFRYGRLIEHNQGTVLVVTPQQMVSGAAYRVVAESSLGIDALARSRTELLACLRFELQRAVTEERRRGTAAQAS